MIIRWRLLPFLIFTLASLAGCAVSKEAFEKKDKDDEIGQTTSLFTYYQKPNELFHMYSIDSNFLGDTVIFTGAHYKDGRSKSSVYITTEDEGKLTLEDLMINELDEASCYEYDALSADGNLIAFHCNKDFIYVYDLEKEKVLYESYLQTNDKDVFNSIITITNEGELILTNSKKTKLHIENIYSNKGKTYDLLDLLDEKHSSIEQIKVDSKAQNVLISLKYKVYLLDIETKDIELVEFLDSSDNEGDVFSNIYISQNGQYLYVERLNKNKHLTGNIVTFYNLLEKETYSYEGLDSYVLRNITNDGRVLLVNLLDEKEKVVLFNISNDQFYKITMHEDYFNKSSQIFELAPSGNYLIYNFVSSTENKNKHNLLQMQINDDILIEDSLDFKKTFRIII